MAIELPDGTVVRNIPEQVAYLTEANERLARQLQMALSGVMKYKGSVATYADLPSTGQEVGDVYNVIDTGANYCWSGTEWDEIGAPIDFSQVMDLGTAQTATAKKTFTAGIASDSVEQITPSHTLKVGNDAGFHINLDQAEAALDYGLNRFISISDDYSVTLNFDLETYLQTQDFRIFYGSDKRFVVGSQIEIYKPIVSSSGGTYGLLLPDTTTFTADKHIAPLEDVVDLVSEQTIAGAKTFSDSLKIKNSNYSPVFNISIGNGLFTFEYQNVDYLSGDGGRLRSRTIIPKLNNTYDLGSTSYKFKDAFISGILSDGTNTASIADIKALIDYAKAQGWIQ